MLVIAANRGNEYTQLFVPPRFPKCSEPEQVLLTSGLPP